MDDIVLPPMPDAVDLPEVIRNYARAAVIADRERREKPEPPKAHQAMVYLGVDGLAWLSDGGYTTVSRPIIRWTNDGRVWIESEDRWKAAGQMRMLAASHVKKSNFMAAKQLNDAADLLDGGER